MTDRAAIRPFILETVVFVCGALVMIYEIIGSRIVSPFIGTSTYVWTSLIGVILGALSLGYWLGGRIADRRPDIKILAYVIFIAGGLVSVTILLKEIVLAAIASADVGLELRSVAAALILFAPASVALGVVTPFAVKLKMLSLDETGKTVGRLYALSTLGSIAGTFAAGFFLIPFLGSVRTLYLIAGSLILLAILMIPFAVSRTAVAVITLFVLSVSVSEAGSYYLAKTRGLHDIDTEYSRVQVFEVDHPESGRRIRAIATDPYFFQSAMYLDGDDIVFEYNRFYHLLRHFRPETENTLMIGGAGYTFPKEYLRTYPNARMDVVEIDPMMTEIARQYFGLRDDPRLNIIHEDGRVFLNNAESGKYDVVLMDAFGSLFSVPYQLTTIEAVRNFHRVLKDDGVVIFNLGSSIAGESSRFLQAELRTYKAVFPQVYLFKVNEDYSDERLQNLMIVASRSTERDDLESGDEQIAKLLGHVYERGPALEMPILTDDLAPVEYYNSFAHNLYRAPR